MTGRPNMYRQYTMTWLTKNFVPRGRDFHLLMRNNGDLRSAPDLKQGMLEWLPHYDVEIRDIVAAYDDHPGIIEMYKRHDIPATQLMIHKKDAYVPPQALHDIGAQAAMQMPAR
jgi:hypothetical protein